MTPNHLQTPPPAGPGDLTPRPETPAIQTPAISLPKGGGAIRGIEEKFQVHSVSGTSSLHIPLPITPARGAPEAGIAYNSGNGNSPFGLGWELSLPSIRRKTQKGIPRYDDANDSDTFVLAAAEDLVPMLEKQGGSWLRVARQRTAGGINYTVTRYRPRIDNAFSYIEHWKDNASAHSFWKTVSTGNVHTYYGLDEDSRIQDPGDSARIFEWLPCRTHDDKGHITLYAYKREDRAGMPATLYEKNRTVNSSQRYLKKIIYGNKTPYYPGDAIPAEPDFLFQLVFDYGEHDAATPVPASVMNEAQPWPCRKDPFSTYRAGFEIRTYRRCRRVLMFHCFGADLPKNPCLVRSLELMYKEEMDLTGPALQAPGFSYLRASRLNGHIWDEGQQAYTTRSFPDLDLRYQQHEWNDSVQTLDEDATEGAPSGLADKRYLWIDLYNEGLAGLLTEQGDGWYYKSNLGDGAFSAPRLVNPMPSLKGIAGGTVFLQELAGDGTKYLVQMAGEPRGFFRLDEDGDWQPMKTFLSAPATDTGNPNLRTIDVTGDGLPDLLVTEDGTLRWYAGLGEKGFELGGQLSKEIDEEKGPAIVFADRNSSIFLADMNGDGLTDIVRIRNGETCYWPNLGYGRFGARVAMDHAPVFDHPDAFSPQFLRLADIDGSGTIDLLYFGKNDCRIWMNRNGNEWPQEPVTVKIPVVHNQADLAVLDLLGAGTACIVYSTPLGNKPIWYIDLMHGKKPHLMTGYANNCGLEVGLEYTPSTRFYLEDRAAGRPWIAKLPFPVHCLSRVRSEDKVRNTVFTSSYRYSHGYFDTVEREFRGFGRVEQWDTDDFSRFRLNAAKNVVEEPLHQPPARSVSWFHTGAFIRNEKILHQYRREYFQNSAFAEYKMPEAELPDGLTNEEWTEAFRACKGLLLRNEVYADDGLPQSGYPYSAAETTVNIKCLQPRNDNKYACFQVLPSESISYGYDRNPADPRITHSLMLKTDDRGLPLATASVVYKRLARPMGANAIPDTVWNEQNRAHITIAEQAYTNDVLDDDTYRLREAYEARTYELGGVDIAAGTFVSRDLLRAKFDGAAPILFEEEFSGAEEKRLTAQSRSYFLRDDLSGPMPIAQLPKLGIGYKTYQLAFTKNLVTKYYGAKVTDQMLADAKYVHLEGDAHWWTQSGETIFPANARARFYLPSGAKDVFGNTGSVDYDSYFLSPIKTTDAVGNTTTAFIDYRTLMHTLVTDANGNRSAAETDELGFPVRTALMGKAGSNEGDTLADPTTKLEYNLLNWKQNGKPNFVHTYLREKHGDPQSQWQESYAYADGGGSILMIKSRAEAGKARQWNSATKTVDEVPADPRWVGNGRTIVNNKGNVIKSFEPYFSTTHEYESEDALVENGFSSIAYYDAVGRNIRTEQPDGTFSKTVADAWHAVIYDVNDTVRDSQWYADRLSPDPAVDPEPADPERRAAWLAAKHHNTPGIVHTDSLGRQFYAITDHGGGHTTATYSETDAAGRYTKAFDEKGRLVSESYKNMTGAAIYGKTAEKGENWVLADVMGRLVKMWDNGLQEFYGTYDQLNRPVSSFVRQGGTETLYSFIVYGEDADDPEQHNLRGRPYLFFDQAGLVTTTGVDFKGNTLSAERRIAKDYIQAVDWTPLQGVNGIAALMAAADALLEDEVFPSASEMDALNRPVTVSLPDKTVFRPTYGVSGMLVALDVQLRGQGASLNFLQGQDYNARGQRQLAKYGNGLITQYFYDPRSFELTRLLTKAAGAAEGDSLQDLFYTFDPAGNIVQIRDDAQQTHFFNNAVVKPESKFEYDALYQLIKASGRELAGIGNADAQRSDADLSFINQLPHVNNSSAVRIYTEEYEYDDLGNITRLKHLAAGAGWTRNYRYEHDENPAARTNRLKSSSLPGDAAAGPYTGIYTYDAKGNMTSMPHLPAAGSLSWNFADQLKQVNLGGGGTAYYVYGAGGGRFRKIIERPGGKRLETIYLGVIEIYREYQGASKRFERTTLHIADSGGRIAQVDTKVRDLDNADPANALNAGLVRYQYGNHLGSASLETDGNGNVLSYEEYHPYGTSAYRSGRSGADLSLKRYRYSGKERDEETGLYYFGARYYAPWLGRWTSADPAGFVKGFNLFKYCSNNPVMFHDPDGMQDQPGGVRRVSGSRALSDRNQQAAAQAELERMHHIHITSMHFGPLPGGGEGWIADEYTRNGDAGGGGSAAAPGSPPAAAPAPSDAPPPAPTPLAPAASASGGDTPTGENGHGNIMSAGTTNDSFQRRGYEAVDRRESAAAQRVIEGAKESGDAAEAMREAERVSTARNVRRTNTQGLLTPQGRMLSRALEGERGFEHMRRTYSTRLPSVEAKRLGRAVANFLGPTNDEFEIARRIAVAAGETRPSMRFLGRVGRYIGPIGMAASVLALGNDIYHRDWSMAAGDSLTVIGSGIEMYGLAANTAAGTSALGAGGATVAGIAAVPLGLAIGGVGLAVTSGISFNRARKEHDTAGMVAGGAGVVAGTALAAGGTILALSAAGVAVAPALVAAAPVIVAVGAVLAVGVGLYHLGRAVYNWW